MKVLRSRRSIRRFKSDPVPKEDIEAVLNAMKFAPTARNSQTWHYIVLTDQDRINLVRNQVIEMMALLLKVIKRQKLLKPILPKKLKVVISDPKTKLGLDRFFKEIKEGKDPVFYSAPVVIISYGPNNSGFGKIDAAIAITYGMLAAQAREMGTCWIGYAQEALKRSKKGRKALKIPESMEVNGVFVLGYPNVKFHRAPPRKTLKIEWN
ncbi:MAG: nitroreductase family protein [Candidatus Hermodarchaeota archaeon]